MKIAVLLIAALGVGFAVGFMTSNRKTEGSDTQTDAGGAEEELGAPQVSEAMQLKLDDLAEENASLNDQLNELKAAVAEYEQLQALAEAAMDADPTLAIAFGKFADLEELLDADWNKIGTSMLALSEGIQEIIAKAEAGEDVGEDFMNLQEHNLPLIAFALAINGKLPSHGMVNGVFTHPLAQVNMMSEMLAGADVALTETQAARLQQLGLQFEKDWDNADRSYGDGTQALEKLLDEADLKREFLRAVEGDLDQGQREVIFPDSSRDLRMLDLFSPALMFSETGHPLPVQSAADLRGQLVDNVSKSLGVTKDELNAHGHIFDTWVADVQSILSPIPADDQMFYDLDQGIIAGRAQSHAVNSLLQSLNLTDEQRAELLDNKMFIVPRVIEQPSAEQSNPTSNEGGG
ncbi:MAG: hypothetical protein AAF581_02305 [Planctomycetota bacterium]